MSNSILGKLAPREPQFIPLLKEMTAVLLVASDLIIECVQNHDHETTAEFYRKIKEQEKKADELSNRIFEYLNSTFILPFDREDINRLSGRLDDVIDHINSCAKRIALYKPKNIPSSAVALAKLIREGATCMEKIINELGDLNKNARKIKTYCKELQNLESKADDIYELFVIELFENEKDGIEIIKLKEIMHELEKATDATEYVGKKVKTFLVKYA